MRSCIYFLFILMLACKAQQITDTQTREKPSLDFHYGPEFDLYPMGEPQILGPVTITPIRPGLAVITSESKEITSKTVGSPHTFVHKDKSRININSGNVDRSKDKSKVNSDNVDKSKDKSKGDTDRSRWKFKVSSMGWLMIIGLVVLLVFVGIRFVWPKIKNYLKPPGL
ncbi:hypothetical protein PBT90_16775 [Algoriphagus halophytocola]|uniref:hypothetical protein n=1 Tax=Algoriphagus halophytocola TaxID=2991499 RepID=UPI0022DD1299|nr:hypothetical protein [Algoriphagus sp. TR-M9]WBL42392.1 hypothetical protein PBT90_16775 [Algoriphagus sp. TR-M9]